MKSVMIENHELIAKPTIQSLASCFRVAIGIAGCKIKLSLELSRDARFYENILEND